MKVFDYDVDGSRHCREGVATGEENGLFDTFWGVSGERHRLTEAEAESARLRFNTDDFEEVGRYSKGVPSEWAERHPDDRETIPSQHGLQQRWFIRKGSQPDHATRLANAQQSLEEAESALRSAESRVLWAREDVEKIKVEQEEER